MRGDPWVYGVCLNGNSPSFSAAALGSSSCELIELKHTLSRHTTHYLPDLASSQRRLPKSGQLLVCSCVCVCVCWVYWLKTEACRECICVKRHEKQRDPPSSCFRWVSSACIFANKGQRMSLKSQKENKRGKGSEDSDSQLMRKWMVMQVRRTTQGFFNRG